MSDVKQIRRLKTSAVFDFTASDGTTVALAEHKDGGPYDLHPLVQRSPGSDEISLLLPDPNRAVYALILKFDKDTAGRLGRALLAIERNAGGVDEPD